MPVTAWDPTPYPDPRPNRNVPGEDPNAALAAVANPNVSRLVFHVQTTAAAEQRTAVSRRIVGPALIKRVRYAHLLSNALGQQTHISLVWGRDGGGAGSSPITGAGPTGTKLFETAFNSGGAQTENVRDVLYLDSFATARVHGDVLLDEYVTEQELFLKYTLANPGATSIVGDAVVTVYENVDPEILLDLLG